MDKFLFDTGFQWDIIKFTLTDRDGYKALLLYKPTYFDLIEQRIITTAIQRFYKTKKKIPRQPSVLIEELKKTFKSKDYVRALKEDDRRKLKAKIKSLYRTPVKDGDEILAECKKFASYVELRAVLEKADITDFSQYSTFSKKIQSAINVGSELEAKRGTFMVSGVKSRAAKRKFEDSVIPSPFYQINSFTNAGGYPKGSIVVVVDKQKGGKTSFLVNVGRGYLRQKKNVVYFDLENGEDEIATRLDQSVLKVTKKEILSGQHDARLAKIWRKYARLKVEFYVCRVRALCTTDDLQAILDDLYKECGLRFDIAIIDYAAKMGSLSGKKDDFERISDAYVDLANFADKNNLDAIWTGHHIKDEGFKRRATKYQSNDLAKCIDIGRHVHAVFGINQDEEEEKNKVFRLEIIDQRDGKPEGRAFFWYNRDVQRVDEFSKVQLKAYYESAPQAQEPEKIEQQKRKVKDI